MKEVQKNPKIEVSFNNSPKEMQSMKTMRVSGKIEFLNDPVTVKRLVEERTFL
jgi:hypothetical protein